MNKSIVSKLKNEFKYVTTATAVLSKTPHLTKIQINKRV